jgi:hypothetical protein
MGIDGVKGGSRKGGKHKIWANGSHPRVQGKAMQMCLELFLQLFCKFKIISK